MTPVHPETPMRHLLLAALLALPAGSLAAPAATAPATAAADARLTIPVKGMSCHGCVQHLTATLQQVEGVTGVEVSLERKQAVVTYRAGRVEARQLVAAVTAAGFEPGTPSAH